MADVEVARLVAKLEADVRDFDRDLRKAERRLDSFGKETKQVDAQTATTSRAVAGLGSTFGKLGLVVGGMAAVTGFARFAGDSIRASSDLNESINALNVVYKENAAGVLAIGENASTAFGMSKAAFNQFAVRFSAFAKNIAGEGGDVVATVDEISQRVADFASVHNLSLEEAAQVAQSTLAGETEVFRRFGGDVSAAAVNAKALELGLAGVGDELTEQEKQLVRYQLFMEQTADTAGDFANTSDDLANKQRILAAKFEDAKAQLGEGLVPAMEAALDVALKLIDPMLNLADTLFAIDGGAKGAAAQLRVWARQSGFAVGTAENLGGSLVEVKKRLEEIRPDEKGRSALENLTKEWERFIEAADLSPRELQKLVDHLGFLTEAMDLTAEEAAVLEDALRRAFLRSNFDPRAVRAAFGETRQAIQNFGDTVDEDIIAAFGSARDQLHNFGGEVTTTADRIQKVSFANKSLAGLSEHMVLARNAARELRIGILELTNPFFAAYNSSRRATQAQEDYAEALATGDPEAILEASFALSSANIEAELASQHLQQVAETDFGGFLSGLDAIAQSLEVSRDEAVRLLETAGILDGYTVVLYFDLQYTDKTPPDIISELDAIRRYRPAAPISPAGLAPTPIGPPGIPALQHGGPAMAGHPYLVGETGPELFIPNTSGQVVPGMGGTYNLNVTVEGNADMNTVQAIQEELLLATLTQWSET